MFSYCHYLLLALFLTCASTEAFAGMTLLNDNGDWALVTLGVPDDDNFSYRACKNSGDRIRKANNRESLAILCVTYTKNSDAVSLALWLDEARDEKAGTVRGKIAFNGEQTSFETSEIKPAKFGKMELDLTNDAAIIKKALNASRLRITFANKFTRDANIRELEFDPDPETFVKVAPRIHDYLKSLP